MNNDDTAWDRDVRAFVVTLLSRVGEELSHPEIIACTATMVADAIQRRREKTRARTPEQEADIAEFLRHALSGRLHTDAELDEVAREFQGIK